MECIFEMRQKTMQDQFSVNRSSSIGLVSGGERAADRAGWKEPMEHKNSSCG